MRAFILEGHVPQEVSILRWADWLESHRDERVVAKTTLPGHVVSTVFLGLDHSFNDSDPPLLFETMVFASDSAGSIIDYRDLDMARCSTWEQAEAQHDVMVQKYTKGFGALAPPGDPQGV